MVMQSCALAVLASVVTCSFTPNCAYAQKIHAILAADTSDGSIGAGITENVKNIRAFLRVVHTLTDLDVSTSEVSGDQFDCNSIVDAMAAVNPTPNDAVVFYYSGHGFRQNSTQSQFPEFYCIRSRQDKQIDMSMVVKELQSKQPRFVLAIADTCNVEVPPPPAAAGAAPVSDQVRKAALLHLFVDYSGTLMMSGAVPGEFSWYMTSGSGLGGFFTNQLLRAINSKINDEGPKVRWEDIAADATQPIFVPTNPNPSIQRPQYAISNLVAKAAP
jgi:Caspase domain